MRTILIFTILLAGCTAPMSDTTSEAPLEIVPLGAEIRVEGPYSIDVTDLWITACDTPAGRQGLGQISIPTVNFHRNASDQLMDVVLTWDSSLPFTEMNLSLQETNGFQVYREGNSPLSFQIEADDLSRLARALKVTVQGTAVSCEADDSLNLSLLRAHPASLQVTWNDL